MNGKPRWSDAETAAAWVRDSNVDRAILRLLIHLPLLPISMINQLVDSPNGLSTTYRHLAQMRKADLVSTIRPATMAGHAPALHYLTDLGIATVGLLIGVEPAVLAHQYRLRAIDLAGLLVQLPQVLACYELLAAVTAIQSGPLVLLAWEFPYKRTVQRLNAVTPLRVEVPAYVAYRSGEETHSLLLYPDLGTIPLRAERLRLSRLIRARLIRPVAVPALVVATDSERRAHAWQQLLEEVARQHSVAPLPAQVMSWGAVHRQYDDESFGVGCSVRNLQFDQVVGDDPPATRCRRAAPLPSLVGKLMDPESAKTHPSIRLGQLVLQLGPTDEQLLELVAQHPFLSLPELAVVLAVAMPTMRQRCNRLIAAGLLALVNTDDIGECADGSEVLAAATRGGLTLVAARRGLSLAAAVHHLGLAGGGSSDPIGQRTVLLRQLMHTRGVNDLFVRFHWTARQRARAGHDESLVAWRNAAACARGHLRPDAYGVYRHHGWLAGFFLEYDRGTMSRHGYAAKFASYYAYRERARFDLDYDGFPTILMVTTDDVTEERIANAALAASVGRAPLPLLLTCLARLDDLRNRSGLLGPIWREARATLHDRRPWFEAHLSPRT